jgi:hypothetical protein
MLTNGERHLANFYTQYSALLTDWQFLSFLSQEANFRVHSFSRQHLFVYFLPIPVAFFFFASAYFIRLFIFYGSLWAVTDTYIFAGE